VTDPEALAKELLAEPNFGHLGTVNRDGSVQVSPVWVHIEQGRLEVSDRDDGYRSVEIRGTAHMTHEGAREHINELALKYTGEPFQDYRDGVERVKVTIVPLRYIFHH
jgi:hypothetical protein